MDSFYNPNSAEFGGGGGGDGGDCGDAALSAARLDVYVHHARDIHNICIYADQDVYAKLSLTRSPDEAASTRVAAGGGKNPRFDELLSIEVAAPQSAVLKCEIWMLSRAKNFLDDQLLGFALVPLSSVAAADGGRLTRDFALSSTDLFHSPAGTVRLTLSLDSRALAAAAASAAGSGNSCGSISSEVVILDPADFRRIGIELELPDAAVAKENQRMVAEYFDIISSAPAAAAPPAVGLVRPSAPFLRLGSSPESIEDFDMIADDNERSNSPDDDDPSSFASSTTTSLSDETKKIAADSSSTGSAADVGPPDTPTSKAGARGSKIENDAKAAAAAAAAADLGPAFESPMGNVNIEAEQAAMQQQIVEMYMKSMQQFTESLAKMKLPMDLDNPRPDDRGVVIQNQGTTSNNNNSNNNKLDVVVEEKKKKKDGSRVFYGSRAFF